MIKQWLYSSLAIVVFYCFSCKPPSPKLDYMEVEEGRYGGTLYLYGSFGDSTASSKVKVGNYVYEGSKPTPDAVGNILSWTSNLIKVGITYYDSPFGSGDVYVISNGQSSNKRVLNMWKGTMTYTEPDEGTIMKKVVFDFALRADAQTHKSNMILFTMPSSFASWPTFHVSKASWTIGGTGSCTASDGSGQTVTLTSESGTLDWSEPYKDRSSEVQNFQSEVKFQDRKFIVSALKVYQKDATDKTTVARGSTQPYVVSFPFQADIVPTNKSFNLELDDNNAIKAGMYDQEGTRHANQYGFFWDAAEAPNHMHIYKLEWGKIEPKYK